MREWLRAPAHHEFPDIEVPSSDLSQSDVDQLIANGLIRPIDASARATVRAVAKKELKRGEWRRRSLFHTHAANDGAHTPSP